MPNKLQAVIHKLYDYSTNLPANHPLGLLVSGLLAFAVLIEIAYKLGLFALIGRWSR